MKANSVKRAIASSVILGTITLAAIQPSYADDPPAAYSSLPGEVAPARPTPPAIDRTGYEPPRRMDGTRESVLGSEGSGITHVPGVDSASSRFTGGGSK